MNIFQISEFNIILSSLPDPFAVMFGSAFMLSITIHLSTTGTYKFNKLDLPIGNKPGKKIGIQVRDKEGRSELKTYLTDDNTLAGYPVLSPLNEHRSIVAYTVKSGDKPFVSYQLVDIE